MVDDMFELIVKQQQKQELANILACNSYTKKFGVTLTEEDVKQLMLSHRENLREQERVEFHGGILEKLVFAFCDSPYIYQDNYVDSIERLQEIFYQYKNESMDELSDDELLKFMREHFDGDCQGSLDFLEETCLEAYARLIRARSDAFFHNYQLRGGGAERGDYDEE